MMENCHDKSCYEESVIYVAWGGRMYMWVAYSRTDYYIYGEIINGMYFMGIEQWIDNQRNLRQH